MPSSFRCRNTSSQRGLSFPIMPLPFGLTPQEPRSHSCPVGRCRPSHSCPQGRCRAVQAKPFLPCHGVTPCPRPGPRPSSPARAAPTPVGARGYRRRHNRLLRGRRQGWRGGRCPAYQRAVPADRRRLERGPPPGASARRGDEDEVELIAEEVSHQHALYALHPQISLSPSEQKDGGVCESG